MPSAGVVNTVKTCGSGLARDCVGTFRLSLPDIPLSLASQLPTGLMPSAGVVNTAKTCGSGLARDGVGTSSLSLPDIPLSLASQLPQGFMLINSLVHTAKNCRSQPAGDGAGRDGVAIGSRPAPEMAPSGSSCSLRLSAVCRPRQSGRPDPRPPGRCRSPSHFALPRAFHARPR